MTAVVGTRRGVDAPAVGLFLVVSSASAWALAAPLWCSGRGLADPAAQVLVPATMLAPSLGVLAVLALRRPQGVALATGLRSPGGIRSWWRWGLLAWLGPVVLAVLALLLAAAVGVYRADPVYLSGFDEMLRDRGVGPLPVPLWTLAALQLVQALVVGWVNVIPALGEEWGWRGWLLPELLPLGRWPAILSVGVVWGLWHAPVLLLGYDYPLHPPAVRVLLMVGACLVLGSLLGWLRLRSGSVWPAAIGHGFVNAVAGLPVLFATADVPVDNAATGLLGWTGWVVMAAALVVVAALTRSRAGADAGPARTRAPEGGPNE